MAKLTKELKVNDNRIMRYTISENYTEMHTIQENFFENGKMTKDYRLQRWDDYAFTASIEDFKKYMELDRLTYEFDINHPLYMPLLHLLNGDESLIIDDDDTGFDNKKYLEIHKEEDKIVMEFINKLEEDESLERFNAFVKNILSDLRSKIDSEGKDTKERLHFFFQEAIELFSDYHQLTIEEYFIKNKLMTKDEAKKYIRKYNSIYNIERN